MKALEDLLSISATRFKVAADDFRDDDLNTWGVRAATARAYADVATAIAIHKHAIADAADAESAVALLRDAETAELVYHNAMDRARRLGAY
jgi:hypothetical protein